MDQREQSATPAVLTPPLPVGPVIVPWSGPAPVAGSREEQDFWGRLSDAVLDLARWYDQVLRIKGPDVEEDAARLTASLFLKGLAWVLALLVNPGKLRLVVKTTMLNRAKNRRRSELRRGEQVSLDDEADLLYSVVEADDRVAVSEGHVVWEAALTSLSPMERKVMRLAIEQQLEVVEIALVCGIAASTAKTYRATGMQHVRSHFLAANYPVPRKHSSGLRSVTHPPSPPRLTDGGPTP